MSLKYVHLTDLHLNPLGTIPQGRTDTFHEDVRAEFMDLADVCRRENVTAIFCSGDIFNLKSPSRYSPRDILYYKKMFESFKPTIFCVIPGNHDMAQASVVNLDRAPYTLLVAATDNMVDVTDKIHYVGTNTFGGHIGVRGFPYLPVEEAREKMAEYNQAIQDDESFIFTMLHVDALREGVEAPPWISGMGYDELCTALPNANAILLGHIHHSFPIYKKQEGQNLQFISKPFAFGRVVRDYFARVEDVQKRHVPSYCMIEIMNNWRVTMEYRSVKHRPFEQVFSIEGIKRRVENNAKFQSYFSQLEQAGGDDAVFNLEDSDVWLKKQNIPPEILDIIEGYLYDNTDSSSS